MKSVYLVGALVSVTSAAPTLTWSPTLSNFYTAVNAQVNAARANNPFTPPSCDLLQAEQPTAPTPLPSPDSTWKLVSVVVGRGVQNYTCALASEDVKPVLVGAVANLYNTSCIAANYPRILEMIPNLALQYSLPASPQAPFEPSNLPLVGHHYFLGNGTPTFDFSVDSTTNIGIAKFKKGFSSTAPSSAPRGENEVGDGSVPWLFLPSIASTSGNVVGVYRLNTAGGSPPTTCQSSPAAFSVQYATEYWFYTKDS